MQESQRQKQKDLTRKHIIEVAIKQFGENGFTNTRTLDIAKAAKVSHGTIFAHFSTQEELLNVVIEEFGYRVANRLHELVNSCVCLKEVLNAHLLGLMEFELFYTRLVIEGRLLPESARITLTMIQSAISFHINQVAEKEIACGMIRPLPIHLLFNTWMGLIHYYLTNNDQFAPGESVLKRYGQELLQHYMLLITWKE
jgi:AcrR family transcriptional regulator